MGAPKQILFGL